MKKKRKTVQVSDWASKILAPINHEVRAYLDVNREKHLVQFNARLSDAGVVRAVLEGLAKARVDISGYSNLAHLTVAIMDAFTPRTEAAKCR
jgi:hypothetical protein